MNALLATLLFCTTLLGVAAVPPNETLKKCTSNELGPPLLTETKTREFIASLRTIPLLKETYDGHTAYKSPLGEIIFYKQWNKFEDEYVSFFYPDTPNIRVEVFKSPNAPAAMSGALCTSNHKPIRTYWIMHGEHAYCAILLERTDRFDDGICFCGAIAFNAYRFHNNSLYRFSFLASGETKKIQIRNGNLCAVFLEWTHLPIHQNVYNRIALSLCLKGKPCDRQALMKNLETTYGLSSLLGFLETGMSKKYIIDILGSPIKKIDDTLCFHRRYERKDCTYRIPLENGRFTGDLSNCVKCRDLPPKRGTSAWIYEMTVCESSDDYDLEPLTTGNIKYIFDRFCELAPGKAHYQWVDLCEAMSALAKNGHTDPRVPGIVRKHLMDCTKWQFGAVDFLKDHAPQDTVELLVKLADKQMACAAEMEPDDWAAANALLDLFDILNAIGSDHAEYDRLIVKAMTHPHSRYRFEGYLMWNELAPHKAIPLLRAGLQDRCGYVREEAARAFAQETGTIEDLTWLKQRLDEEKNQNVRWLIEDAIERISRTSETSDQPAQQPGNCPIPTQATIVHHIMIDLEC